MNDYILISIIFIWFLMTGFCVQIDISSRKTAPIIIFCFVFAPILFFYKIGQLICAKLMGEYK